MRKIKVFSLLVALFFLMLAPLHITHAKFSDSVSNFSGIELELGSVGLAFSNPNQTTTEHKTIDTNNKKETIQTPEIKNIGSLGGKLFYKVELFKTIDGKEPIRIKNIEEKNIELMVQMNEKEEKITSSKVGEFQPIITNSNQQLILNPSETTFIPFAFSSSNLNTIDSYTVKFTFLLIQSDGTVEKPMFHDIQEMVYQFNVEDFRDDRNVFEEIEEARYRYAIELPETLEFQEELKGVSPKYEKNIPVNQDEVMKEKIQVPSEESNGLADVKKRLLSEVFKHIPIKLNEKTYNIGVTQDQFNWLLNFSTVQEFSDQLTEDTPPLYVKYDQVTGIEDIEQFVYQLAEEKQLNFEIKLKDIPEHKLLEITFTK